MRGSSVGQVSAPVLDDNVVDMKRGRGNGFRWWRWRKVCVCYPLCSMKIVRRTKFIKVPKAASIGSGEGVGHCLFFRRGRNFPKYDMQLKVSPGV